MVQLLTTGSCCSGRMRDNAFAVHRGELPVLRWHDTSSLCPAADIGRRLLIDARRSLFQARTLWYPIVQQLHRCMIAVSRVAVNHDGTGGSALILWFGIREDLRSCVRLTLGIKLILLHCLGLVGF